MTAELERSAPCAGVGEEPVLVDGHWVCPKCGVDVPTIDPFVAIGPREPTGAEMLAELDYEEYLRSDDWAYLRRRLFEAAGGRCQGCNTPDDLEAHHRTYERLGHEELDDLTALCAACHTAVHLVADGRRGKVRKRSWIRGLR